MSELFGSTRAHIGARHALITPTNHVNSSVPGIVGATTNVLINPAMGAKFAQLLVTFQRGGSASVPTDEIETFGFVMRGGGTVVVGSTKQRLGTGGYFFAPAGTSWNFVALQAGTQVTLFQKKYEPLPRGTAPQTIVGDSADVPGTAFLGDPAASLKVLLPDIPAFDLAVNLFTYQPGGHLPFVEVHVMEHGLVMLAGEGVYRLEDSWYPVRAGDAIWMAPYCAQWFVAMGKTPATYLYYKDVNRAAL